MADAQLTVLGSAIRPGDTILRYPTATVAAVEPYRADLKVTRTFRMANGAWYAVDRTAEYKIVRPAPSRVLVIGPASTADELRDLSAYCWDAADQSGRTAVVATDTDHDVTAYAAVYAAPGWMDDWTALVLGTEAWGAGVPLVEQPTWDDVSRCTGCRLPLTVGTVDGAPNLCGPCAGTHCSWCGTDEDRALPYSSDEGATWDMFCRPCARQDRRETKRLRAVKVAKAA
ncbi:hypothetical protein KNE206_18530 [Kitasatospora sp. NE20-6]|uniref:hypothetical protein n=1 Tax=Kitasatospora sp. NE20-6 TaxID=2859066 RepID=UPI0034DB9558